MRGALLGLLAASSLLFACGDGEPNEPHSRPESVEQFLDQMVSTLGKEGQVLHIEAAWEGVEFDGTHSELGSFEAWIDFEEGAGRIDYVKGPDNQTDTPETERWWLLGERIYRQYPDSPGDEQEVDEYTRDEIWDSCVDGEPFLATVVVCGLSSRGFDIAPSNVRVLDDGEWEGAAAAGIGFDFIRDLPESAGPPATPSPTPSTGTPTIAAATFLSASLAEFYVDHESYLPLALTVEYHRNGDPTGSSTVRYESEVIERDDLDKGLFDPRAAGFLAEDEEWDDLMDNAVDGAPVYWLGRATTVPEPVGDVRLVRVDQRHNETRPTLITLAYERVAGGSFVLEVWHEDGWLGFLELLNDADDESGRWPFRATCLETAEYEARGYRVRMLAGHGTETGPPPSPGPYTGPPVPCSTEPPNEFSAEVYVDEGYLVTINGSVGLFDNGDGHEPVDSVEALLAIAGSLELRREE